MWSSNNKNARVKIPKQVIKREAQKMMRAAQKKERAKEKRAQVRERAKAKAKQSQARAKAREEANQAHLTDDLRREIWGAVWIGVGLLILGMYFSSESVATSVQNGLASVFGVGRWVLPLGLVYLGATFFTSEEAHPFPPIKTLGLCVFSVCTLGLINMGTSHQNSLALSDQYGGAIGFTVGYFGREFLGDIVTTIILLVGMWVGAKLAFRLRLKEVWVAIMGATMRAEAEEEKPAPKKATRTKAEPEAEPEEAPHFENELEIVDNTTSMVVKVADPMTEAKNKPMTGQWEPPSLDILKDIPATDAIDEEELRASAQAIQQKLAQFNIPVTMKAVHVGPTVTQFTLMPDPSVKLSKITALKNDLALALAAQTVRIEAPIRGKSLVGIEIPNAKRAMVGMKEILLSSAWQKQKSPLKLAVGRNVAGKPVVADLAKMPHLLIAGKTGSGKSVAMNAFLCSLLWQNSPDNLKLILVDPKRVELSLYNHLPHLLTPVIVEPEKCVSALAWAVAEMNRRYQQFAEEKVRNISEYNEKFKDEPERREPYIVIVIDELADLMMVAGKDVEAAVCRIAQMARAVGMHLMIATQRPSVDVVTGLIKANLPARIGCKVSSGIDSRTIIDQVGAEDLLGFGDMLSLDGNTGELVRIQGLYVSNQEVERLTNHIKLQFPEMVANDEITKQSIEGMAKGGVLTVGMQQQLAESELDERYQEAVTLVLQHQKASASFLQRMMEMGYARAARILDQMEKQGVVGPVRGAKPREIYGIAP